MPRGSQKRKKAKRPFHAGLITNIITPALFSLKQGQDFLLHTPLGGSQPEGGGGRLTLGAQPLPSATPSDAACACEACSERRYLGALGQGRGMGRMGAPRADGTSDLDSLGRGGGSSFLPSHSGGLRGGSWGWGGGTRAVSGWWSGRARCPDLGDGG